MTVGDRPTNVGDARELAQAVADKAGCGYLEDFSLLSSDRWAFSCQFGTDMYVINTATTTQLLDASRSAGSPYTVGAHYIVTPDLNKTSVGHLSDFPGLLVLNGSSSAS